MFFTKTCFFLIAFILSPIFFFAQVQPKNAYKSKDLGLITYKNNKADTVVGTFIKKEGYSTNFIKLKKDKITPADIDSVKVFSKKNRGDTLIGFSIDNKFLFNTVSGKIKAYAMAPYSSKKYAVIFSNNGDLHLNTKKFRRGILKEWVQDDPESLALWKKYRSRKLILRTACPLGLMIGGLTASSFISKNNKDLGGAIGISSLFFPALFYLIPPIHPSEIVEKYNASKRKNENFFND